jgi:AraC-like DNA-binding protein
MMTAFAMEGHRIARFEAGGPGRMLARPLAEGEGWSVADVDCTCGPRDRPFEERHTHAAIAVVVAGSFQYRSPHGRALMTPGSLFLGNPGDRFECAHEHGAGDRCIAFRYSREYFERVAADVGCGSATSTFRIPRLPGLRPMSSLIVRARAGAAGATEPWDELALQLAACALRMAGQLPSHSASDPPGSEARVSRAIRAIEGDLTARLTLGRLAREAGLSPYHFLRTFQRVTGVTPHQYVRRARLHQAATRLVTDRSQILDVALDSGFGDVSNFNRSFRAEFGVSPRQHRRRMSRIPSVMSP